MHTLNESKLRLSRWVESRVLENGIRLMKQQNLAEYLALNSEQQRIIDRFQGTNTVQEVLHALLREGTHPKIRAFYDLVLTALNKGFLIHNDTEPAETGPIGWRWRIAWSAGMSITLSAIFSLVGIVAFAFTKISLPQTLLDSVITLVFLILGLSFGNFLAGVVLSSFERQVYSARIRCNRLIPYFSIDTRDAFMGGRLCEICVAFQKISAPFLLTTIAWFIGLDAAILGSCLSVLIFTSPFGNTPSHNLLYALFRIEYQLPKCASKFLRTKVITQIFNWKERLVEEKYLLLYSTYAICWLGAIFHLATSQLNQYGSVLIWNLYQQSEFAIQFVSLGGFSLLVLSVAVPFIYLVWLLLTSLHRLAAPYFFRVETALARKATTINRPADEEILQFLRTTLLFSQLPLEDLKQVTAAITFTTVDRGVTIIREREIGHTLFVIYSGKVAVMKETEAGENIIVAHLTLGDVFGEIALLDQVRRTSTVHSTQPTSLLMLDETDFKRLMVSSLGAEKIRTIVQICSFLRANSLFADWHPQALLSLAKEFVFQEFRPGDVIIREGYPNAFFYLVYEGEVEVRKQGTACARLRRGDFCGEISLLRDISASADIVAVETSQCLKLDKEHFLKFVSQDFLTGFAIETALESRLTARATP